MIDIFIIVGVVTFGVLLAKTNYSLLALKVALVMVDMIYVPAKWIVTTIDDMYIVDIPSETDVDAYDEIMNEILD